MVCRGCPGVAMGCPGHLSHIPGSDGTGIGTNRRYRRSAGGRILPETQEAAMLKRVLFFIYGVTAYLIFLATFLYAIAFVGGFAVPRQLDGPLQTSLPAALAIDAALLTIFAVQHSVMARRWFKERWTQI